MFVERKSFVKLALNIIITLALHAIGKNTVFCKKT